MEIKKRNRSELKSFFVKNAIPTEGEFAELIEGMLNQKDDGIAKLPGSPLSIEASGDAASQKKTINLYTNFSNADPDWVLSLNPRSDPAKPATAKPGFSLSDNAGNSRLFVDQSTGSVGIGTVTPGAKLDVSGNIFAGNSDIYFTKTDHNHSGIGNTAGYAAIENAKSHDALMILGRSGTDKGRAVKLWDYLQVNGSMDVTGTLSFGSSVRQMLNLYNLDYGVGVQSSTQYFRTAKNFAWFKGGAHHNGELNPGGGTVQMVIKDGNVGIGTSDPKRNVHIDSGGQIALGQSNSVVTDSQAGIYWHGGDDYAIHRTPGAWTAPTYQQLRMDWPTGIILAPGTGNNAGYEKSYVEITQGKGLRVTQGNVGIGEINPADSLDVSGGARFLSGSNPVRFTSAWSNFPAGAIDRAEISNDTGSYKTLMIIGNRSDNASIRRVSVWDRLEVNGTLIVNPGGVGNFVFETMSGLDHIGSTYVMRPHATYHGSIGHPSYLIRNMYVHDLWYNYDKKHSDMNIKKNIRSIPSSFSDLLKLKGRLYDIRESAKAPGEPKEALKNRLGFIAQEVKEVFPQLVSFNEEDQSYYMEYDGIIPIIVEAIKEFKTQSDQKNNDLQGMIEAQNLEISRLKAHRN